MKFNLFTPQLSLEPHLQQLCLYAAVFVCTLPRGRSFELNLISPLTKPHITIQILSVENSKGSLSFKITTLQKQVDPSYKKRDIKSLN